MFVCVCACVYVHSGVDLFLVRLREYYKVANEFTKLLQLVYECRESFDCDHDVSV